MAKAKVSTATAQARRIRGLAERVRELESDLDQCDQERAGLEQALREFVEEKAQANDPGYLRMELAYARGQLHQNHVALKQLCGRISMQMGPGHDEPKPPATARLNDDDHAAIVLLVDLCRKILATNADRELARELGAK